MLNWSIPCFVEKTIVTYDLKNARVWVAGHSGMVGAALVRRLALESSELLLVSRGELDLRRQTQVEVWLQQQRPDVVFLAAARVGGIFANSTYPAQFLYDNLMIEANVIEAARHAGVSRLVLLGSSCIYPKCAPQPIPETALLTGELEPTNEAYAIAKITGIKLVQAYRRQYGLRYIAVQPTNMYGPNDNFDLNSSHVIPALIRKAHEAKIRDASSMRVWGTGSPRREFMHVDDLADALVYLATNYEDDLPINVGSGEEVTIREVAELIKKVTGFSGLLQFDSSKPDGTPRKLLNVERLHQLGWMHRIGLEEGLRQTYSWYLKHGAVPEVMRA
jgi:GDP-L-fucose synthase